MAPARAATLKPTLINSAAAGAGAAIHMELITEDIDVAVVAYHIQRGGAGQTGANR